MLIARRLGASRAGAAIAGLVLALHPIVWEWSLAIEAFALNAALALAIVYFLVRWHQQPQRVVFLILAALCGGLASSNHQTIVFLVPVAMASPTPSGSRVDTSGAYAPILPTGPRSPVTG